MAIPRIRPWQLIVAAVALLVLAAIATLVVVRQVNVRAWSAAQRRPQTALPAPRKVAAVEAGLPAP